MKVSKRDLQIMENFEHIYAQKIDIDGTKAYLRESQIKALFGFDEGHCFSMQELANTVRIKLPRMSCMIDSLIKDGIAELDADDKDPRKVMVRLTPLGAKIQAQFLSHRRKVAKSIFNHLSNSDKAELLNSLDTACKILAKIS